MKRRSKEAAIIAGAAVSLVGAILCGAAVSCGDSDPAKPKPSHSAEASPPATGNALRNPKMPVVLAIGGTIAKRWHEALPQDRTFSADSPVNASVTLKAAGKCTIRLAISSNGQNGQADKSVIDLHTGGSISASVECPGKRPIGMGAHVQANGTLNTYWSQANTQIDTLGDKVRTSDPIQQSFGPDAASKIQDQTLAQLNALANLPIVPAGKALPGLPPLPKPVAA